MKKQIIVITSLPETTQVSIRNRHRKLKPRHFASIDEAVEYVLPRGNRYTELYLNGYSCVLNGWADGTTD